MFKKLAVFGLLVLGSSGSTQGETNYLDLSSVGQIDNFLTQRGFYQESDYGKKVYLGREGDSVTIYCSDDKCSSRLNITAAMVSFGSIQTCQVVSQYLQTHLRRQINQGSSVSWLHQNGFKYVGVNCSDGVPHLEINVQ